MPDHPMAPQELDEWDEKEEQLVRRPIPNSKDKRDHND